MTPQQQYEAPTVEARYVGESLSQVQQWAYQTLGGDEWRGVPVINVSQNRSADGRWYAHMTGWPAQPPQGQAPTVYVAPVGTPAPDGPAPLDPLDPPPPWRPIGILNDGVHRTVAVADLGDILSGRPVPVVPGYVPASVRAAAMADADRARAAALDPTRLDLHAPLELDLETEAPAESRRARRKRERAERAAGRHRPAATDQAAGNRVLAQQSYTVPDEGPGCPSRINTPDGPQQCRRRHLPGLRNLKHTAAGYLWSDDDPRIIHPNND